MDTRGSSAQRTAALIVAWVVVAAVMALFAWQAVSAAGSRVSDQPLYPLSAGAPAVLDEAESEDPQTVVRLDPIADETTSPPATEDPATLSPTTAVPSMTVGSVPTTQQTAAGSSTTTTAAPATSTSTSATSTTAATTTSTTTTQPSTTERATYVLVGGTVTIEFGGGQVVLVSAVPKAGFDTEVESDGPTEVDLDFRSEGHRSKFDAEWNGGQLVVDIDEDPEG